MSSPTRITALSALSLALLIAPAVAQDLETLRPVADQGAAERAKLAQVIVDSVFSFGELGFQEVETSRYLTGVLRDNGFEVEEGIAGIPTAWMARWGSGSPVIALGSDIDGIPKASQKPGVAYFDPLVEGRHASSKSVKYSFFASSENSSSVCICRRALYARYRRPTACDVRPKVCPTSRYGRGGSDCSIWSTTSFARCAGSQLRMPPMCRIPWRIQEMSAACSDPLYVSTWSLLV